ncbi:alpha/beta fold hydrolase [Hydrococcus rivularis]|uniref:alpha/beta fold hydrolase n=1 Tax=Hydrococcus rivularis TaxID=1616834 RepID=UPI000AC5419B|nr:alpha/beta hydrolase [Hydrococcus rivularis]
MFPSFIASIAENLTESTSIALIQRIESHVLATPLSPQSITTTYTRQGRGKTPFLLLHGFDSSLLEFRRLMPLLAQASETWAVDLLGFGFTERLPGLSFSPAQIKAHLYYFWKTLIQQPVILVGASMGGATAIDFTLAYPEAVKKLVLLDSAGLSNSPMAGKLMFPPLDYWATEFLRNPRVRQNISRAAYYDKSFASRDAQLCAALHLNCPGWREALIAFTKSGGYGNFSTQLSQIQQSSLILWGKCDRILGTKAATQFEQLLPNSQLVWIENCGHVPHLEQPQITAERILEFVGAN